MSVVEDSIRTIADDLALSRKLDLEVLDLVKRVDALETKAAASAPIRAQNAWGDLAIRVVRVFLFTGISTFITLITGLGAFPDMATAKSIAWSAVVAGMADDPEGSASGIRREREAFTREGCGYEAHPDDARELLGGGRLRRPPRSLWPNGSGR